MSHPYVHQLSYKPVEPSANPRYRYLRIPMNNVTGSGFPVTTGASQLVEFRLPSCVYNLAQSSVGYQLSFPAQGANLVSWSFEDCFDLATNAYFGTAGGLDLCNLNYVNRYTKIARKMKTKVGGFISTDSTSQLAPCNVAATANFYPVATGPSGGTGSSVNNIESKYIQTSVVNTATVRSRLFPLNGIVDTIFSVDKDLYIPTDMYIRFTAGVGSQMGFQSAAVNDPSTAPAALSGATGTITVANMYLFLAVEQNQLIIDSVMSQVLSGGLKLNIPYTTAFRNATNGPVANIQIPLTQQYGKRLKRMLHTVWSAIEASNTALDCNNWNGNKIISYNTFMDQRQLQDFQLSTADVSATAVNGDDWRENKKYIQDSVIFNRQVYGANWFHCDQFYETQPHLGADESQSDDGLVMDSPKLWMMQAIMNNSVPGPAGVGFITAYNHYNFATFVRSIEINRTGVQFV